MCRLATSLCRAMAIAVVAALFIPAASAQLAQNGTTPQNVTANVESVIGVTTFVDVDQALTGSLGYTNIGNNATPSSTLAGTAAGDMVVDYMTARMNAGGTLTAAIGAGQTSIYNTTS